MTTNNEATYWNDQGELQDEYDRLSEQLVPLSGPAETPHGEILRCATNVYWDLYANDGGNLPNTRDFQHIRQNVGTIGLEDGSDAIYTILQIERALSIYDDLTADVITYMSADDRCDTFSWFLDSIDKLMSEPRFVAGLESVVTHVVRHCMEAES